MKRKLSYAVLAALGAFALVVLSGVPLPYPAHAQASPSVAVSLSSASVEEGAAITVTMSFSGLESDSDTATRDYVFRADVVGADECEDRANGYGLGVDRYMWQVDEDPEVRTGSISADCPAGDYILEASISSPDSVELASATASFTVTAPAPTPTPEPAPLVAIALFPSSSVEQGTAIAVTMGFIGLQSNWDTDTTDYIFRADVVDADACEGDGLGVDRYMYQVDEDPETRTGAISAGCPAGDYTLEASISSPDGVELASARASFSVAEPEEEADDSAQQQTTLREIPLLRNTGNPGGLWSDRTTIWVSDGDQRNPKLHAYTLSNGNHDSDKDIALHRDNFSATGIWSDGTTIWVADNNIGYKLYAYTLSNGNRDSDKDITLHSDNRSPEGIWSDGTTIWVVDSDDHKLYAYTLSGGARDSGKEFGLARRPSDASDGTFEADDNRAAHGLWSDGTTMWVVDHRDHKVYAYTLDGGARDTSREFGLECQTANANNSWGLWSDGTTMLVKNAYFNRLVAYILPDGNPQIDSTDASLCSFFIYVTENPAALSVPPQRLALTSYSSPVTVNVDYDATEVDVTAVKNHPHASHPVIKIDGTVVAYGTVPLAVGLNTITVEVTAQDGLTSRTYTIRLIRAATSSDASLSALSLSGVTLSPDFASATTGYTASVANGVSSTTVTATKNHAAASVLITPTDADASAAGNQVNLDVGSNTVTVKVTAEDGTTIRTYRVTVTRAAPPASSDASLSGLALSGVTLAPAFASGITTYTASVANSVSSTRVTATKNHAAATVLITPTDADTSRAAHIVNLNVGSNAVTVKVTAEDGTTTRTYTVRVTRPAPPASSDVVTVPADWPLKPSGLGAGDQFRLLIVTSTTRNATSTNISDYDTHVQSAVAAGHASIQSHSSLFKVLGSTANVAARDHTATTYTSADKGVPIYWLGGAKAADEYEDFYDGSWDSYVFRAQTGHEISPNRVWTGTNNDGTAASNSLGSISGVSGGTKTSGKHFVDSVFSSGTTHGFYGLSPVFQVAAVTPPTLLRNIPVSEVGPYLYGIWSDGTTIWVVGQQRDTLYAYTLSNGDRDSDKDIELHRDNFGPRGLWSDGTTIWVVDWQTPDDNDISKIFAYTLTQGDTFGNRSEDKEIDLLNTDTRGLWSDGTTIWVANTYESRITAYTLDGGARDSNKDIALHADNGQARGLWSDGTTMWVVDRVDEKVYAYTLDGGARDTSKEFSLNCASHYASWGIWSDGTTMWVTNNEWQELIAYRMPDGNPTADSTDATLCHLGLYFNPSRPLPLVVRFSTPGEFIFGRGADLIGDTGPFSVLEASYGENLALVHAVKNHPHASVVIKINGTVDADGVIPLAVGLNTITVEVTAQDGLTSRTYTITIRRAAPAVSVGAAAATAGEGDVLTFTVTRTPAAGDALTLTVNVSESGDLVPAASEGARTVTIAADATEETLTVATGADDTDWEEHSTVSVTASPSTGYTLSAASASTLVEDDDFPEATAALTVSPTTVGEPGTVSVSVTVTTNADQEPHGPGGTVTAAAGGGTATSGSDYDAFSPSYTLDPDGFSVVTVGGSQRWQRVYTGTVMVRDDAATEGAETFNVALTKSGAPKVTLASPSTVAVTIRASDALPTLSGLSVSPGTLTPAFASGTLGYAVPDVPYGSNRITVTATPESGATVAYRDGSDAGLTDVDAATTGDQFDLAVGENVIKVRVTRGSLSRTYTLTVTRAKPQVSVGAAAATAGEGDVLTFTVTRTPAAGDALTLTVNVSESGDLVPAASEGARTVTIAADATEETLTVATGADDTDWEEHSTVSVTASPSTGYTLSAATASTLVEDDDFPEATAALAVSPTTVGEPGTVSVSVTVTTNADQEPHGPGGTVTAAAGGGTATSGSDYDAFSPSYTLVPDGFSVVTVGGSQRWQRVYTGTVMVRDDAATEAAETFNVVLTKSGAPKVTLASPSTVAVTIRASDALPTLSGLSVSPGTLTPAFASGTLGYAVPDVPYGSNRITVTATPESGATVAYRDGSDAGLTDVDAATTGDQFDLAVGENVIKVRVTRGSLSRTYTLTVTRAKPQVSVGAAAATAGEGDTLTFTVTRTPAAGDALTLTVNVSESGDLVPAASEGARTVTIAADATEETLVVATETDDSDWEEHSTVSVTASPSTGYTLSAATASTLVEDDDFPEATAALAVSPTTVGEPGTVSVSVTVTTNADQEPHGPGGTVTAAAGGGTATSGSDYDAFSPSYTLVPDGFSVVTVGGSQRWQRVYTGTVAVRDDAATEAAETFNVALTKSGAPKVTLASPSTVAVTIRASDALPTLSGLSVSPGTLTPAFASGTLEYAVPDVPYGSNRITVTATPETGATVAYEDGSGNALSDADADTAGDQFDLEVGENTIKVKLTKGSASQTYTLTLTRAAPAVSVGAAAATAGEGDTLTFTVTRTPAAGDALTLTVNVSESGDLVPAASEGARTVTIAADATEETLVVATETDDSDWEEHSTVSVTASPSTGYTLSAATASTLVEDDDFPEATAALAVSPTTVGEPGTVSVSVTVTTNADQEPHGPGGTVTAAAGGGTATSGSDYDAFNQSYALDAAGFSAVTAPGGQRWQRVYTGTVTVKDDAATEAAETFNVVLTKSGAPKVTLASPSTVAVTIRASDAPAASSDASLSALSLSSGTLSPGFTGATTRYAASVINSVSWTTVTATTNHAAASVLITPTDADANRAGDQVNLDVGSNVISVKVTAEDGTTRTYTVTVTRAAPPASSDASLSGLSLSGVTLTPDFASGTADYTASVANSVSSTTVTATKNHAAATVVITPADADANAAGRQVSLTVGFTTVTVKVTAEDGATTRTYTVIVTRATAVVPAVSSDASLSGLSLSGVTLTPTFSGDTISYAASVANGVSSTTVTATKNQAAATVVITPDDADASATGYQVGLNVGSNTITVKVTAPDGVTTRTYTVTITRAATGAAPSDITLQAKVLVTETVYEPQGGVIVAVRVRTDSYAEPQRSLTLTVQSFPDTAHVGTDYLPFTTTTVTFNPDDFFGYYDSGFFEAIKHVAHFRIVDDNTQESNEQLIISVSTAASSASIATTQGAIVTIEDGDEPLAPTSLRQPRVTSAIYDADEDAVVLKWAAGSDTQGLTGYRIDRSAPGGATELTHADLRGDDRPAVGAGVSSWNDTTVPASYLVLYRVWAVFSDGSEVASYAFPATMDRGIVRARVTHEGGDNRYDVSWTDAAYPLGDGSLHYGVCPGGYKVYVQVSIGGTTSWHDVSANDTDPAERTYVATGITALVKGAELPFMVRCGGDSATTGLLIGEDTATVQ